LDEDKDTHDLLDCPKGWSERGFCTEDNYWPFADQYIRVCMKDLNTEEQVSGGCYTEKGSCKSGYYKLSGGLRCCPRLSEEQVAGGCYTEKGSCKSGYYKLSGGLRCCPRLSEVQVSAFRENNMFCGRNECKKDIWVCENAFEELDEDKDTHDLLDCPKGWSQRGFCTEYNHWPFADQYIRVCMKDESAIAEPYSGPSKDCYSFDKNCSGCRGYLDSCCSHKNCGGGRKCKAGIWSYSCDN